MARDTLSLCRCLGHPPQMGLMAVLALHIHVEVDFVLADLRCALMATQTILILRLNLARSVRLVAFVAVKLHRRCFGELNLLRLFNDRWIGREEPHIHGCVLIELLSDVLICAVAVETL